jgi:hypothetical protein
MGYSKTQQATGDDITGEPGYKLTGRESCNDVNRAGGGWLPGAWAFEVSPDPAKAGTSSGMTRCFCTCDAARRPRQQWLGHQGIEGIMATREQHQIVETPTEARQAEPGPSVLALLTASTGLAVLILGVVWFVFFRT